MSSDDTLLAITSKDEFELIIKQNTEKLLIIHFSADWAEQCRQVEEVLLELKKKFNKAPNLLFAKIEAEKFPEIAKKFCIEAVPTCIFFKKMREVTRVNGVNTAELVKKVEELCSVIETNQEGSLENRLKFLINQFPVMVFMKGSPDAPKCGFSKTLVDLLNDQKVIFKYFDILTDEDVRQGLKEYSNWPTYPQVYIDGELIGGLDIIKELIANGEFSNMIPKNQILENQTT